MSSLADPERTEILLALALAFGDGTLRDARTGQSVEEGHSSGADEAPGVLAALNPAERLAVERRYKWYTKLGDEKQKRWLSRTFARARSGDNPAQVDEHIHPSQVVEVLRAEPARIQTLVLGHLPPSLAAPCAESLGVSLPRKAGRGRTGELSLRAVGGLKNTGARSRASASHGLPSREIMKIVRQAFMNHFTSSQAIPAPTPLDLLSGVELARLARLLGVRETATACRGISSVEAVTAFLRRFAAEDARAILAHITTLTNVDPERVAFAEQTVHDALKLESDPGAMLDRVGLRQLAFALAQSEPSARLRYTSQKLPVEAARWLEEVAAVKPDQPEMARTVASEVESLAASLRRRLARGGPKKADPMV
jgi:hypothetical protein